MKKLTRIEDVKIWDLVLLIGGQSLAYGPKSQAYAINGRGYDHTIIESSSDHQFQEMIASPRLNSVNFENQNNYRFGLGIGIARRLANKYGLRRIATISRTPGGHSITTFIPLEDRLEPMPPGTTDHSQTDIDVFNFMLRRITQHGAVINKKLAVWFQGSSDRGDTSLANAYQAHLEALLSHYRGTITDASDLPFLILRSPNWNAPNDPTSNLQTIRSAQETVGGNDANAMTISIDDPLGEGIVFPDGTHPDSESHERICTVAGDAVYSYYI